MNIQIDHTSFNNLGAELMHDAIIRAVKSKYPNASFIAGKSLRKSPPEKLQKAGLLSHKINNSIKRILSKQLLKSKFEPWNYGLLLNDNIDVVFDAGGFRFGDQWMHNPSKNKKLKTYYSTLKKRGAKIIFLPQAFGPFEKPASVEAINIVFKYADLIYARDQESFHHLNAIFPDSKKIKIAKDFTIDVSAAEKNEIITNKICIIPNKRMLTHVVQENTETYLNTLVEIISLLLRRDFEVFLMSFCDVEDLKVCHDIREKLDNNIPIYSGLSGSEAKAIIKSCYAVYSSRYHGVVSALNQNVPCMTSSWSHKYGELLAEYKMKRYLSGESVSETINIFNDLLNSNKNLVIRNSLLGINHRNLNLVNEMWNDILRYLNSLPETKQ
ncbi:MAG: polysaccharide pyruvyl transferase family protein [Bacteroidota bacterium]